MPVYLGDVPLDSAAVGATAASAIYLGSTKIWPAVEFPYIVENTNVTDADAPIGASGCWVTLVGGGAGGRLRSGGGGGAAICRFFIPRDQLGDTWTLTKGSGGAVNANGTASVFVSGSITLTAGGGSSSRAGGVASVSGITGPTAINGAAGSNVYSSAGDDCTGAGAGGGCGGDAYKSGSTVGKRNGSSGGTATAIPGAGFTPGNGGKGGNGNGRTAGSQVYLYDGGGGGGGGATNGTSGTNATTAADGTPGVGGTGLARVEWVSNLYWSAPDVGSWSFTPPAWAQDGDLCDVVIIGGGASGAQGSNGSPGDGGNAATYTVRTITLGVDLAPTGTLSGTVGAGGAPNGGAGSATTCTQLSMSSAGATGTSSGQAGKTPTPVTVGGTLYNYPHGAGGDGGPSRGVFGWGDGTAQPGQRGGVFICVRGG